MGCNASSTQDKDNVVEKIPLEGNPSSKFGDSTSHTSVRQSESKRLKGHDSVLGKELEVADIKAKYEILEELGRGHFAVVHRCRDKETKKIYALKIIDRRDVKASEVVKEEIAILKRVGQHKHVVGLLEAFWTAKDFYLIMDYCGGGDLFSKIYDLGSFTEGLAQKMCLQLALALKFIHDHNVSHRDLKPENILLSGEDLNSDLKIADFGLSKIVNSEDNTMKTVCGTWAYCAPEVIERKPYTSAVDIWTLGVLTFILLSGYHPFDVYGNTSEVVLLRKIVKVDYDFDDEVWDSVSSDAKSLIQKMLVYDPVKRLTIDQFIASEWITGEKSNNPLPAVVERIGRFSAQHRFRAMVLAKLASKRWRVNAAKRIANRKMAAKLKERNENRDANSLKTPSRPSKSQSNSKSRDSKSGKKEKRSSRAKHFTSFASSNMTDRSSLSAKVPNVPSHSSSKGSFDLKKGALGTLPREETFDFDVVEKHIVSVNNDDDEGDEIAIASEPSSSSSSSSSTKYQVK